MHVPKTLLGHIPDRECPSWELCQRTGIASTVKGAKKVSERAFSGGCRVLTAGAALAEVGSDMRPFIVDYTLCRVCRSGIA